MQRPTMEMFCAFVVTLAMLRILNKKKHLFKENATWAQRVCVNDSCVVM